MKPEPSRSLLIASLVCLVLGWAIMSPSGRFLLMMLAALFSVAPAVFTKRSQRIFAIVLFVLSLLPAAVSFSPFQSDQQQYRERAIKAR